MSLGLTSVLPGRERREHIFANLHPTSRQTEEGQELFLYLLLPSCLQLKITFMPKRHSLGWHVLLPFNTTDEVWLRYMSAAAIRGTWQNGTAVCV